MGLNQLTISYPDFQLNTVINPEHFDTNNLEIVTKINELITYCNNITGSQVSAVLPGMSAITVQGILGMLKEAIDAHNTRTDNPHQVTASQVDTYTKAELEPFLKGGDTVIKYEIFTIRSIDYANNTFVYTDSDNNTHNGRIINNTMEFKLFKGVYNIGLNRIECTIDDTITRSQASGGLTEVDSSTVLLNYIESVDTELTFKYYERIGLLSASSIIISPTEPLAGYIWFKEVI